MYPIQAIKLFERKNGLNPFKLKVPDVKLTTSEVQCILEQIPRWPYSQLLFYNIQYVKTSDAPSDFFTRLQDAVATLFSQPVGRRLLIKIAFAKHRVSVWYSADRSRTSAMEHCLASNRDVGTSSRILLSDKHMHVHNSKKEYIEMPFFIEFAHELIHAYHHIYGKERDTKTVDKELWSNDAEFYTIAGGKTDVDEPSQYQVKPKISENAIRKEHGLCARFGHHGLESRLVSILPATLQ